MFTSLRWGLLHCITFMTELHFPLIGCDNSTILSLSPLTDVDRRGTYLDRQDWKDSAA